MKKIFIFIFLICLPLCISLAQQRVKIGNLEFSVRKSTEGNDTIVQIDINDRTKTVITRKKDKEEYKPRRRYHTSSWYIGLEFMLPDNGADYLKIYSGKSYQFNTGYRYCFHPTRWYGIGVTGQYAFYNYRLKDASEPMIGAATEPYKEVFRSNNLGVGVFNRFYIFPGNRSRPNSDGVYIDAGVQGEWSYGRFYKSKLETGDYSIKNKYRNGYAFNPFTASAFAGIGFGWFEVHAHYRFTDVFNKEVIPVELPRMTIGVTFNID